jgi:hypothetical protein
MNEIANKLLALAPGREYADFFEIIGADKYGKNAKQKVAEMYSDSDEETTKKLAVKYSRVRSSYNMFDYEDRLCELMGDDEYFEWADANSIK